MTAIEARDLTVSEFASAIGRHPETIRRLARQGRLPGVYKFGGMWMIRPDGIEEIRGRPLEQHIAANRHGAEPPARPEESNQEEERVPIP